MQLAFIRLRFVRALMATLASLVLLWVALPGPAQAAQAAPARSSTVAQGSDDYPYECFDYSFNHGSRPEYHYYQYCYDWKYKNEGDWSNHKRWYSSYSLYYWYYDNGHHWKYGSCHWNHDFGYSHPNGTWQGHKYCPQH